jgi:hypothetical protein
MLREDIRCIGWFDAVPTDFFEAALLKLILFILCDKRMNDDR